MRDFDIIDPFEQAMFDADVDRFFHEYEKQAGFKATGQLLEKLADRGTPDCLSCHDRSSCHERCGTRKPRGHSLCDECLGGLDDCVDCPKL